MSQALPCGDNWHQESGSFYQENGSFAVSEPDNAAKRETYITGVSTDLDWNPSFQWTNPPLQVWKYETKEQELARRFYSEHLARGGKPTAKAARRCWKAARSFYEAEEL